MSSDLRTYLVNLDAVLQESHIKMIFYQILLSVRCCHSNGVVHRDIKMENILVDVTNDGKYLIKLTDFGIACHYKPGTKSLRLRCGSLMNVAPEMLKNKPYDNKVDVWALGVMLHELLSTQLPFYSDDD